MCVLFFFFIVFPYVRTIKIYICTYINIYITHVYIVFIPIFLRYYLSYQRIISIQYLLFFILFISYFTIHHYCFLSFSCRFHYFHCFRFFPFSLSLHWIHPSLFPRTRYQQLSHFFYQDQLVLQLF